MVGLAAADWIQDLQHYEEAANSHSGGAELVKMAAVASDYAVEAVATGSASVRLQVATAEYFVEEEVGLKVVPLVVVTGHNQLGLHSCEIE